MSVPFLNPRSIRGRLTVWYVLLLAFTLAGYSAILISSLADTLEAQRERMLTDEAQQAIGVLNAVNDDAELKEQFRSINVGTVVGLYDSSGQHLIVGRQLPAPNDVVDPPDDGQPRLETLSTPGGTRWRVLVQTVTDFNQRPRVLMVARSAGYTEAAIWQLLMVIGVTAPAALLVAIAGGAWFASRALKPIDQVTRTAETVNAEDLSSRRSLPRTKDEVGRLADTFDHMLERLDRSFDQQRRFTADASHELRTPLAMLVSRAGMALERQRSPEAYRQALEEIRDEGMRMGRVVNDLLMLARADAGRGVVVRERLDVAELVASVMGVMRPLAAERGILLRNDADAGLTVVGDQTRLMELLINLIDNALTHTPRGGKVLVAVLRDADSLIIEVMDTGSGIPPEHLPHVFERFYRGDRDVAPRRPGAGLGLSLCLSIARAHGGDIRIASQLGKGTQVFVRLPLAPDARAEASPPSDQPRDRAATASSSLASRPTPTPPGARPTGGVTGGGSWILG